MVTILDPGKQKETLHITDVPVYLKQKGVHFPQVYAAALALKTAKMEGCSEINIEVEGMLPMKVSTAYVEHICNKYPLLRKFAGLDKEWTLQERLLAQHTALVNGIYL